MQITLKCFAFLGQYLPPGAKGNSIQMEVDDGKTIAQLIDDLNIDQDAVELAILNEQFIDLRAREHAELKNRDTLALWPEVAGG